MNEGVVQPRFIKKRVPPFTPKAELFALRSRLFFLGTETLNMNFYFSALLASIVMVAGVSGIAVADEPTQHTVKKPAPSQINVIHPIEAKLVERTNAERARFGLRPLILDMRLMRTARRHNGWMARSGAFQHGNYPVAENIAMGQHSTSDAMNSWMNSSGHRANILNAGYTKIGVSAYRSSNGSIYWTQQFTH